MSKSQPRSGSASSHSPRQGSLQNFRSFASLLSGSSKPASLAMPIISVERRLLNRYLSPLPGLLVVRHRIAPLWNSGLKADSTARVSCFENGAPCMTVFLAWPFVV